MVVQLRNKFERQFKIKVTQVLADYWVAIPLRYFSGEKIDAVQVVCTEDKVLPYRWLGVESWYRFIKNTNSYYILVEDPHNRANCRRFIQKLRYNGRVLGEETLDKWHIYLVKI